MHVNAFAIITAVFIALFAYTKLLIIVCNMRIARKFTGAIVHLPVTLIPFLLSSLFYPKFLMKYRHDIFLQRSQDRRKSFVPSAVGGCLFWRNVISADGSEAINLNRTLPKTTTSANLILIFTTLSARFLSSRNWITCKQLEGQ